MRISEPFVPESVVAERCADRVVAMAEAGRAMVVGACVSGERVIMGVAGPRQSALVRHEPDMLPACRP